MHTDLVTNIDLANNYQFCYQLLSEKPINQLPIWLPITILVKEH